MKTFEDIAPITVPDRQTDRLTWVFIELLAAAKCIKHEWLVRHYTGTIQKIPEVTVLFTFGIYSWWRHQMETFSALLGICAGNSPVTGEFPARRPVTRSSDVFFDLRPNKQLSKQWWGWWFETPSCPLWRHRNGTAICASARSLDAWKNESLCAELCVRACDMQCAARIVFRADSRFAPRQWETALLCNDVSHWLGTSLK